jgi:conjugal transfer pilus assembly protein TraA
MPNTMSNGRGLLAAALVTLAVLLLLTATDSFAGTGGSTEFGSIYTMLTGWLQGILGRILAVTFVAVGLVGGVMRGSMMGLVLGIACGLGVYTAPTVIDNIVTATLL